MNSDITSPHSIFNEPTTYKPEVWAMRKDTIYEARDALACGIENTEELLIMHDRDLGRSTKSNRLNAERLEQEIQKMKISFAKLGEPGR